MYFYVIMPFRSDQSSTIKRKIIEDIAQEYRLVAHFPEYSPDRPSFNVKAAILVLSNADFVIVDLSLERPSCYYELGLAEALKRPVYLIAKAGTDIHQTANRDKAFFFEDFAEFEDIVRTIL